MICYKNQLYVVTQPYEKKKLERKLAKKNSNALVEMAKEARELGMTYGQYVAKMEGARCKNV